MYQRINHSAVGGEIGNHVRFADDDLSVQDVVVGVVAAVDDKREIHHKSGGVALTVGAGIGLIGWHTVVDQELVFTFAESDKATACAFNGGNEIGPTVQKL